MKKLLLTIVCLYSFNNLSAQAVNWYAWIINNSTNKNIYITAVSDRYWDNWGWSPCDTNWNWAYTSPGGTSLKCGGTNNRSVNGWLAYVITVKDLNGNTIYEKRHSWDVHNDYPANLSIKNGSWDDGGNYKEFRITDGLDDKDAVVFYVFDDNGFSTTLLKNGGQYSYDTNQRNYDLNDKKCQDTNNSNGCVMYQNYKTNIRLLIPLNSLKID
ncbi:MAG TPA: hypothetical protein PLP75_02370 [Burkholderiales bacterium]|jgi:hypothetical protein|nr:hypothetical protein [Burkholderiales bacterium]